MSVLLVPPLFQSPLVQAIFSRNAEEVTFLLNSNEDVNSLVRLHHPPPHTHTPPPLLTPLHRAAASRNEKAVELLLLHRAKVNTQDKYRHTPLHMAAAKWATGCAKALIPHVCSLDVADKSGRTPLHHAAHSGYGEMVHLLLSKGANVNAKDENERQAIHWAAYLGHVEVLKLLVSHGADVMCKDKRGYTPLHAAAVSGQLEVVKYLLRLMVEIDEPNIFGNTALHMACHTGQDAVATELVNCGANINQPNCHGSMPLHLSAASSSGVLCLELLINNGADINVQNKEGKSPLHIAAMYGRFTGSQILIQNGVEIDCADMFGNTPLHVAARYGQELLISTLLTNGADKNRQGIHGMLPLHLAALHGFPDCCRKLLSNAGDDINILDDQGRTCLHAAASGGSSLHYAAANGNSQCTISLVRAGAEVNELDLTGCSPLHYAAASHTFCGETNSEPNHCDEKCLDFLLDNGANPTLKNSKGYSAVHYAAAYGNKQHLELLLEISFNCLEEVESNIPVSPLHLAAYYGHCEALCLLCETLVSLDVRDIEGRTALHLAAQRGFATCVEVLLKHNASYTLKEQKRKWTALHAAAAEGQIDCLLLLVSGEQSSDIIDSPDTQGQTALMLASLGRHTDCVHILLEKGAKADAADKKGFTALHRGILDSEHCVSALLEHGASALCRDSWGRTPLHLVASRGHTKLLGTLLKAAMKADPLDSILDFSGYTPTHWAAHHGHEGCLHILLENKPFSNQEGNRFTALHCALYISMCMLCECRTALHAAAYSGNVRGLQLVLAHGAQVNAVDHCGCSALMVAADSGQTLAPQLITLPGRFLLAKTCFSNNIIMCFSLQGHEMCALLILGEISNCSLINATNSALQMPLHIAARKGLSTVVQVLLSRGAAVMAVDEEGHTPALACAPNKKVADCLALILSTMKPFPPREAATCSMTNTLQSSFQAQSLKSLYLFTESETKV
uniref:Ankyrin repeat domain 52 n=1 Tax=Gasterosteus aculeatus aculeatus TaxID=481459 RepID=A0AAQ4NW16_GASAC